MVDFHVIIPAKYDSHRFPGKALVDILGRPMIQRVYEDAHKSKAKSVTIATDSTRIHKACMKFTDSIQLTETFPASGTDRCAEACIAMGLDDDDIVVNLQGNEPLMPPSLINQVAENLDYFLTQCDISTLYTHTTEINNPNHVKVVTDENDIALYFSRSPIPHGAYTVKRHIGIYAYRVKFLKNFVKMVKCALEEFEQLEQLRAMYNGARIRLDEAVEDPGHDVTVPSDVAMVIKELENGCR